jgi:type I restriction enzyme S subunit
MELLKVKNFAVVKTGGTPSTKNKDFWAGGHIPWLNSGELNQNIVKTTRNYITELGLKNSSAKLMPENTVLIALTGATTGVVGYLTFEASANQSVTGILPSDKHIPKYLFYYLKSIRPKVLHDAYGGAQPHISQGYVKDLEIPLPPLDQQKKIAAILDAADAYRKKTKALIEKYDELTQSLFLDMFGDPVTNPKGWELNFLENVTTKIGSGATPRGGKQAYKKEGISLIRSMNVYDNRFEYKNLAFIDENQADKLKNVSVEKGDVLFNITGASICRSSVVPEDVLPARVNQHVSILRPLKSKIISKFLSCFLISKNVKTKLLGVGSGGGAVMEAITKEQLQNIEVITPPTQLQNQFADRVQAIEAQKAQAQASLVQAEDLFNSLLQRAFKGELTN